VRALGCVYQEAEAHELICDKKDAAPADEELFDDSDDSEEAEEVYECMYLLSSIICCASHTERACARTYCSVGGLNWTSN
jgi:hypothetical protein